MDTAEPLRVLVFGVGAIGGWVAAKLALAGHDVTVVARGATLAGLRCEGLRLTEREVSIDAPVRAVENAASLEAPDLLIIAVKAPALAEIADAIRPAIGTQTLILPMLNGVPWWFVAGAPLRTVDPDGRIAAAIPIQQLVGCVVHASCSRAAPNHVLVKQAEKLILGEPGGGASEPIQRLCKLFEDAGIRCEATADVRQAIWYKLWGNATINPLSALTRATADRLLGDRAIRSFLLEAMAELSRIGAAIGCQISENGEARLAVTERLGTFKTSMLQDVEAGRPTEIDALVGAPLEIAGRVGVPAPRLGLLYAMTKLLGDTSGTIRTAIPGS